MDIGTFPHRMTRLIFDTGQPYEEFRARYEDAVPEVDYKKLAEFAERGAPGRRWLRMQTHPPGSVSSCTGGPI